MKAFAVIVSGLLLATPAAGQNSDAGVERPAPDAPAADSGSSEAAEGERRICRRVETNTGSRVPFRRLCMTERQWEAYRRQN